VLASAKHVNCQINWSPRRIASKAYIMKVLKSTLRNIILEEYCSVLEEIVNSVTSSLLAEQDAPPVRKTPPVRGTNLSRGLDATRLRQMGPDVLDKLKGRIKKLTSDDNSPEGLSKRIKALEDQISDTEKYLMQKPWMKNIEQAIKSYDDNEMQDTIAGIRHLISKSAPKKDKPQAYSFPGGKSNPWSKSGG